MRVVLGTGREEEFRPADFAFFRRFRYRVLAALAGGGETYPWLVDRDRPWRRVVDSSQIYDYAVSVSMARWREMLNAATPRMQLTKVSRNGTVVLAARARRAAGIEPGDRVVTIPVGPGAVLVERVGSAPSGRTWREFLDSDENPLRGIYGGNPQAYVDELRGPWPESTRS